MGAGVWRYDTLQFHSINGGMGKDRHAPNPAGWGRDAARMAVQASCLLLACVVPTTPQHTIRAIVTHTHSEERRLPLHSLEPRRMDNTLPHRTVVAIALRASRWATHTTHARVWLGLVGRSAPRACV